MGLHTTISSPQAETHLPGLTGLLMLDLWGLSEEVFYLISRPMVRISAFPTVLYSP